MRKVGGLHKMTCLYNDPDIPGSIHHHCCLCGSVGEALYQCVKDYSFNVPGEWQLLHCPMCKLAWLSPRPLPEVVEKIYKDYHTHGVGGLRNSRFYFLKERVYDYIKGRYYGYDQCKEKDYGSFTKALSALPVVREMAGIDIMDIPFRENGVLLDVGCGSGQFLAKMRGLGWEVYGVEVDNMAVAVAREKFDLNVSSGTLKSAHFPDNFFDVVTLSHVIEHVDDPVGLLGECKRVLKEGGKIVITTPNINSLGHKWFGRFWRGIESPRHFFLFSLNSLELCTQKVGFDTVGIRSTMRLARDIYIASRLISISNRSSELSVAETYESSVLLKIESLLFLVIEIVSRPFFLEMCEEVYYIGAKPYVTTS